MASGRGCRNFITPRKPKWQFQRGTVGDAPILLYRETPAIPLPFAVVLNICERSNFQRKNGLVQSATFLCNFHGALMSESPVVPRLAVTRDTLPAGEILCSYCTARCCRYFAMSIDTPTTWEQFDNMRWYLMHGPFSMFVDDGNWFLVIPGDCQHLQSDHRCGAYETRPQICRDYTTDSCEYDNDGVYDQYFETPEQLWEYAQAILPPRKRRTATDTVSLPLLQLAQECVENGAWNSGGATSSQ